MSRRQVLTSPERLSEVSLIACRHVSSPVLLLTGRLSPGPAGAHRGQTSGDVCAARASCCISVPGGWSGRLSSFELIKKPAVSRFPSGDS